MRSCRSAVMRFTPEAIRVRFSRYSAVLVILLSLSGVKTGDMPGMSKKFSVEKC